MKLCGRLAEGNIQRCVTMISVIAEENNLGGAARFLRA
jgi:hypothetical protein